MVAAGRAAPRPLPGPGRAGSGGPVCLAPLRRQAQPLLQRAGHVPAAVVKPLPARASRSCRGRGGGRSTGLSLPPLARAGECGRADGGPSQSPALTVSRPRWRRPRRANERARERERQGEREMEARPPPPQISGVNISPRLAGLGARRLHSAPPPAVTRVTAHRDVGGGRGPGTILTAMGSGAAPFRLPPPPQAPAGPTHAASPPNQRRGERPIGVGGRGGGGPAGAGIRAGRTTAMLGRSPDVRALTPPAPPPCPAPLLRCSSPLAPCLSGLGAARGHSGAFITLPLSRTTGARREGLTGGPGGSSREKGGGGWDGEGKGVRHDGFPVNPPPPLTR